MSSAVQVVEALRDLGIAAHDTSQVTIWLTPANERDPDNALLLRWRQEHGWHLLRRSAGVCGPVIPLGLPDTADPALIASTVQQRLDAMTIDALLLRWQRRGVATIAAPPNRGRSGEWREGGRAGGDA